MMVMRFLPVAAVLFGAGAAWASEIVIPLPEGTRVSSNEVLYDCEGRNLPVTYVNAGTVSLAVLNLDDVTIVASNVISGSGAKYAGAQYIWWTKGDSADLFDLTTPAGEPATISCMVKD